MKLVLWGILTAGILAGCSPPLWSRSERLLSCQCPPASAVGYATQAALALQVTPIFSDAATFHVVLSNPGDLAVTKLNVAIKPAEASRSTVLVRTVATGAESLKDEETAEAFTAAFARVPKVAQ
jgi:hypothetical protein